MLFVPGEISAFVYLSLIRAYKQSLEYSKAEETINAMQNNGVSSSSAHYMMQIVIFNCSVGDYQAFETCTKWDFLYVGPSHKGENGNK